MRAGDLTEALTLLQKSATRDAAGGEVITYPAVETVAAKADPIRGQEYQVLSVAQSEVDIRFTIYYREDVKADWRCTWRDTLYEIVGPPIDVGAKKQWLELMAKTAQT